MTAEPTPSILASLREYALKNPFITMWNLALVVGGLIAHVYFTQIGYFPDLDLKSASSFLLGVALLGGFFTVLLVAMFTVPAWMTRSEMWSGVQQLPIDEQLEKRRSAAFMVTSALYGSLALCGWTFVFGRFALGPGHDELARQIGWAATAAGALCGTALIFYTLAYARKLPGYPRPVRHFTLIFVWSFVIPFLGITVLMSVINSPGEDLITLMNAFIFVLVLIVANALLASINFKSPRAYLGSAFLAITMLGLFLALPGNAISITKGVFAVYKMGAVPHTVFIVKKPACDAVNLLVKNACQITETAAMGCIAPYQMASRVGSEFLLVFQRGDAEIKVPLQKDDVHAWASVEGKKIATCPPPETPVKSPPAPTK